MQTNVYRHFTKEFRHRADICNAMAAGSVVMKEIDISRQLQHTVCQRHRHRAVFLWSKSCAEKRETCETFSPFPGHGRKAGRCWTLQIARWTASSLTCSSLTSGVGKCGWRGHASAWRPSWWGPGAIEQPGPCPDSAWQMNIHTHMHIMYIIIYNIYIHIYIIT